MIEAFRANKSGPHAATPQSEARWEIMAGHPTRAEIAHGAELFRERLALLEKLAAQNAAYPEIK